MYSKQVLKLFRSRAMRVTRKKTLAKGFARAQRNIASGRAGVGRILNYDHYLLLVSLVQVALLNFYTAQTRVVRAMATTALASFASRFSADSKVAFTPDGLPVLDSADGEELSASYAGVELVLGGGAGPSLGPGALHVTTKCVRALLACLFWVV